MANETYTIRSGKQIPVPAISIPKDAMTSIMALQERYAEKGKHYTLTGVVLDVLARGVSAINHSLDYAEETKTKKAKADAIDRLIRSSLSKGVAPSPEDVVRMAKDLGYNVPSVEGEPELTDEELDAATNPE